MGKLSQLKQPIPELVVKVSDAEGFAVRGLDPTDVLSLYYRHTGKLSEMFDGMMERYRENGNNIETADVQSFAMTVIGDAPVIVAEVIALASGSSPDDDEWDADIHIATHLPFPVQADAIEKIGRLTFTSEMPPKKFGALVAGAITAAAKMMREANVSA